MTNDFRSQIYENMNLKDTDELLDIWQANDHSEWSDAAFDVAKEILVKRLGELPPQDDPSLKDEDENDDTRKVDEFELTEWEAKLIDAEEQPEFYDTWDAVELIRKINKVAKWVLVLNILVGVFTFPAIQQLMQGIFSENPDLMSIGLGLLISSVSVALNILITYFPLKALAYILRILMEMEFNSRK